MFKTVAANITPSGNPGQGDEGAYVNWAEYGLDIDDKPHEDVVPRERKNSSGSDVSKDSGVVSRGESPATVGLGDAKGPSSDGSMLKGFFTE